MGIYLNFRNYISLALYLEKLSCVCAVAISGARELIDFVAHKLVEFLLTMFITVCSANMNIPGGAQKTSISLTLNYKTRKLK